MTAFPLEEGDTGEALLPDVLKHDDDAPGEVVQPLLELAQTVGRSPSALMVNQTGLPEYLDDLKWQLAYWEWLAKYGRRKRVWRSGWDHWALKWCAGGDEFGRHTVVVGPWVIALWSCRCTDCKADEAALLAVLDGPEEES